MRDKKSTKYPGYMGYDLFASKAYRTLKPASKDVLMMLYYEININQKAKIKKNIPTLLNRNDIKMPYADIMELTGYGKKTIWTAFKEILAHGFIKVVYHGGKKKGDVNIYGITEDWRKWKPGDIVREIDRNGKAGWQKANSKSVESGSTGNLDSRSTGNLAIENQAQGSL